MREDKPFKRASCVGCIYHRELGEPGAWGCHYMLDTGEKRGCPPERCSKKTLNTKRGVKKAMLMSAVEYFSGCKGEVLRDENGEIVRGKDGRAVIEGEHPPTVIGLALALGFSSRKELIEKSGDKEVGYIIRWALARCEAYLEEKLCETAAGIKLVLQTNFPEWNDERQSDTSPTVLKVELEE